MVTVIERYTAWLGTYNKYGSDTFRAGLGAVLLLSGVLQLANPATWTVLIEPFFTMYLPMTATAFILLHGAILLLEGILLIGDYYTSIISSIVTVGTASLVANVALAGGDAVIVVGLLLQFILALGVALENS